MLSTHSYCLAPWVIRREQFLLGCRLSAIRVSHLDYSNIPDDKLEFLIHNNFIIDFRKTSPAYNLSLHNLKTKISDRLINNWILVRDSSFLTSALLLKNYLSLSNYGQWEVVTDKKIILDSLSRHSQKPHVIQLSHREPIGNATIHDEYAGLLGKVRIIWVGETTEGTHIGPIIQNDHDLEKYLVATKSWSFSKKLIEFGFNDFWPSSLYLNLLSTPEKIANAILTIIQDPPDTCFLIEENKKTSLWTNLIENQIPETTFFETQFWSKGLIRNFKLTLFDSLENGYVSKCRTPCRGIDYLEGNSGKGIDSTRALYSLVGESVERFSAWQSNKIIDTYSKPLSVNKKDYYDISQFHPFGPKWERYLTGPKVELPLYPVKNLTNLGKTCLVPACLIPFPYETSESQYDVTVSSTGGLAVHSDYKKAVINGALELFERNDLYRSFLFQKIGFNLDFSGISFSKKNTASSFRKFLDSLKHNGLRYWCVIYNLQSTLPIVHSFIEDQKNNFFSRGSGSGVSLLEATSNSLVEALQIRQQFLNSCSSQGGVGYDNWRLPSVVNEIRAYLEKFHTLHFLDHPMHTIQYTPHRLLKEIKTILTFEQRPLLVANLPCPINKWFSVRVLIPGFTTHQYPSDSEGGKNILNPIFTQGIPT